jgi:hypothetical protein
MAQKFVSEPLDPVAGSFDPHVMSQGEPALPPGFFWRGQPLRVKSVLRTWRGLKEDRGDIYLKRHYFELQLEDGRVAVVYFMRQPHRHAGVGDKRWWLYTISQPE